MYLFLHAGDESITILSSPVVYMCFWVKTTNSGAVCPGGKMFVCWRGITNLFLYYLFFERQMSNWKCQVGSWLYGSGAQKSSVWVNVNHVSKLSIWGKMWSEMRMWPKSISWGPTMFQGYWKEQRKNWVKGNESTV